VTGPQQFPFAFDPASGLPQLFDVDANICHEQLITDREEHMQKAYHAGVASMLVPASTAASAIEIQQFVQSHTNTPSSSPLLPRVFTTAGIHPYEASAELVDPTTLQLITDIQTLRHLLTNHPDTVVAVGECGLDYSEGFPAQESQVRVFAAQVALACELGRPLFLHVRKAFDDCFRILDEHNNNSNSNSNNNNNLPPVIIHCFTGDVDDLRACLSRGYSLSVSGLICRHEAGRGLREALSRVRAEGLLDLTRVMVETDAPYLGFKGCRDGYKKGANRQNPNVPSALPMVVEQLAKVLDVPPAELSLASQRNASNFFGVVTKSKK
jgi:TatD DNase family protein